jgi:Putative transposase
MAARAEDLLPVEYFHGVFTLPAEIAQIAYWNKKAVYGLLFQASAETVTTIAADPRHLGVRIGITGVLHTWGSALTHHPHVHMIVPGGGLSPDGQRWIACRAGFFLPVRVLSRLFRRLFIQGLMTLHQSGDLAFFGDLAGLGRGGCLRRLARPFPQIRMPSRWGRCHPHPSQTRTCGIPASGSHERVSLMAAKG